MQRILDICESRVSLEALRGGHVESSTSNDGFASMALCVDGTSATRKSTVLARTGLPVRKVQRFVPVRNADTYFPSMMGYIAAGINRQNTGDRDHLNDRSYLNTLEWCVLWRLMDDYVRRKGNTDPLDESGEDAEERREILEGYRQAFRDLAASYHYRALRSKFRALAFVDSNVTRCDETRARRNEGSDVERSAWRFYTPLQNLMYETLYPRAYVDLAWFDNDDDRREDEDDLLVDSLAVWLRRLVERLARERVGANATVPFCAFHLPVVEDARDYSLRNMEVHVYRTFGRLATRRIVERARLEMTPEEEEEEEEDLEDADAESRLISNLSANLANSIPDYVCVDSVPRVLYHEPRISELLGDDDSDEMPRKRLRVEGRDCRSVLLREPEEEKKRRRGRRQRRQSQRQGSAGGRGRTVPATLEECCVDSMFD